MTAPTHIQTAVIQKAAQGDADAQAWLYQQYSKAMFNICVRMTGNIPHAEDVLHDAFIIAFKNLGSLKQAAAFGGWLKQIVVHACINHCKKTIRWNDWDEEHFDTIADEPIEWWTTISLTEVHKQIKSLPDGCRQVFVLYAMEDNSHREIAAQLGITEGTSKSQYHRAKKLLRERINTQIVTHG
ncbi:RNA polymerase sigma factor [Ferruginibacter sp. SUN106]|uniref:RNA polymerase sigma factor n=1 Tax=Ferruginibacter sp. SUN106 TaxID=2978348 RepID=UPI003D36E425